MVRVDKCPNCAAYLPPVVPGTPRRCEYCRLHVKGATATIDVADADTISEAVRRRLEELRRQSPPPHPARRSTGVVIGLLAVVAAIVGAVLSKRTPQAPAPAKLGGATPVSSSDGDGDDDAREAAERAAIEAAGGLAHFDPMRYLAALAPRAEALGGYRLTSIYAQRVRPDGLADLNLGDGSVNYRFRSPSRSVAPPGSHAGVPVDVPCELSHHVTTGRLPRALEPSSQRVESCRDPLVRAPTCTLVQVWKRAIAAGAPADAVASIEYRTGENKTPDEPATGSWSFSVDGATRFSQSFPDACDTLDQAIPARSLAGSPPPDALPGGLTLEDSGEVVQDPALLERFFKPVARAAGGCLARAARGHDAIYGAELLYRLDTDANGKVTAAQGALEPIINGIFQGRLGDVRDAMRRCVEPALGKLRLPPPSSAATAPAPYVVRVRIGFRGDLAPGKLNRGQVRAILAGKPRMR